MRKNALLKADKEEVEKLLERLQIKPPVAAQLIMNFDAQGKLSTVELQRMIWR